MSRIEIVFYGGGGVALDTARYILAVDKSLGPDSSIVVTDLLDDGFGRVDDLSTVLGYSISNHKELSTIENMDRKKFVVTLGHTPLREEKFHFLKNHGAEFYTVIHPSADISSHAKIGKGCILAPFSFVGAMAQVGDNVLVNVRSTIGHDVTLGESCILSPHVDISGSVNCGKSVFFGAGTIVNPSIVIGQYAKFSSGSIVNSNKKPGVFAYGNPAKGRRMFNPETGHSVFATK